MADARTVKKYAQDIIHSWIDEPTAASRYPHNDTPYLRQEIIFPLNENERGRAKGASTPIIHKMRELTTQLQDALRKAVGHDGKNFGVEVDMLAEPKGRPSVEISAFVYSELHDTPKEIQESLKNHKTQIMARLNAATQLNNQPER